MTYGMQAAGSTSQNWLMFARLKDLDKQQLKLNAQQQSTAMPTAGLYDATQPMQSAVWGMQLVPLLRQKRAWMRGLAAHLEIIDAVGGSRGEGDLLSSSAGQDDLQPLHHAASGRHGVVLVIASQEAGAAPIPVHNTQV